MLNNPYTRWAEAIDIKGDRDGILEEYYQNVEPLMKSRGDQTVETVIQKRYAVLADNEEQPELANMPKTRELIAILKERFNFTDATFRMLMPGTAFLWHIDPGRFCFNMPLITNEGCRFVYDKKAIFMPADGSIFAVNNGIPHTFVNAGREPRLHLTFEQIS